MPTSRVNGVGLYWEMEGRSGDPLVMVHGSWGDHLGWASVVPMFSRSFRVLTYDRRGHSRSERPAGQGSVHEDVADLAALITELRLAPAHVVGSSFGGAIVLRLAAERPELFRSLVAHEPPLFGLLRDDAGAQAVLSVARERIAAVVPLLEAGDLTEGARRFAETIAFGPGSWPELPEEVRQTFIFNALTWLDEMRDPDALEFDLDGLRRFPAPALLSLGEHSAPFFPRVASLVAAAMPKARTWTYPGVGHVPQLSHPQEYVRVVGEFIAGVTT